MVNLNLIYVFLFFKASILEIWYFDGLFRRFRLVYDVFRLSISFLLVDFVSAVETDPDGQRAAPLP